METLATQANTWCISQIATIVDDGERRSKSRLDQWQSSKIEHDYRKSGSVLAAHLSVCCLWKICLFAAGTSHPTPITDSVFWVHVCTIDPCIYQFQTTYHICIETESICRLLFFVSVEGASFHGDNMVQCVTTAVVMRRGHSILFQERGDTFITGGFASRLMDTSV